MFLSAARTKGPFSRVFSLKAKHNCLESIILFLLKIYWTEQSNIEQAHKEKHFGFDLVFMMKMLYVAILTEP